MHAIGLVNPSAIDRSGLRTKWLYFLAVLREFRATLLALVAVIAVGTLLHRLALTRSTGEVPSMLTCVYCSWMAMLSQPVYSPPPTWYLLVLCSVYPLLGFILIGEGVVRFAMLMISRRQGEKEWMRVMASTYSDHIIVCGLGHLGFRVVQQLVSAGLPVVALEKDENGRFVAQTKSMRVPLLIRDMKEDQALIDAGVERARIIIIATNDDMANLEVAMDSRRMNPNIRIIMRVFDQQIASKIAGAFLVDAAFSAAALAAPLVVALSLDTRVLSSVVIGDVAHLTAEMTVVVDSPLCHCRIQEIEAEHSMRVLARQPATGPVQSLPAPDTLVEAGDRLIIHCRAMDLATIAGGRPALAHA